MSHWKIGKITIGCTLGLLRLALQNIRKDWKIETVEDPDAELDAKGGLTAKSVYADFIGEDGKPQGHREGCQLVIRMGAGGVRGADIGFTKNPDGTWRVDLDYNPTGIDNMEVEVKKSIARLKIRAAMAKKNYPSVMDAKIGNETVMRYIVPDEDLGGRQGIGV